MSRHSMLIRGGLRMFDAPTTQRDSRDNPDGARKRGTAVIVADAVEEYVDRADWRIKDM